MTITPIHSISIKYNHALNGFWFWLGLSPLLPNVINPGIASLINLLIPIFLYMILFFNSWALKKSNLFPSNLLVKVFNFYIIYAGLSIVINNSYLAINTIDFIYYLSTISGIYFLSFISLKLSYEYYFDSFLNYFKGSCIVLLYALFFVKGNSDYRLSAVTLHANTIGEISSITFLATFLLITNSKYKEKKGLLVFEFILSVIMLIKSFSKTSIVILVLVTLFMLLLKFCVFKNLSKKILLPVICFAIFAPYIGGNLYSKYSDYKNLDGGKLLYTLSGRTIIWEMSIPIIKRNPVLGYGWSSSDNILQEEWIGHYGMSLPHAHNEILNSLIDVGLIGTLAEVLCFLLLLLYLARISIRKKSWQVEIILGLVILIMLRSITEISISQGGRRMYIFFLGIILCNYNNKVLKGIDK